MKLPKLAGLAGMARRRLASRPPNRQALLQQEIARLSIDLERLRGEVDGLRADAPRGGAATTGPAGLSDELYADFEAELRGSSDEVTDMLRPHLARIQAVASQLPVLDVGAGRGEWVSLLASVGVPAYGVDANPAMVALAAENGRDVRVGDGLEHLAGLAVNSLGGVTAFHLVEHLPTEAVCRLIDHAGRVLAPGGLIVLETPNCANLDVGANSFWLDPTHLRPVHPDFLAFLLRRAGFEDVEIVVLHPSLDELDLVTLHNLSEDPARNGVLSATAERIIAPRDVAIYGRKAP